MNFCSCGFIFILFLEILTSKAQNNADYVPSVEIFEIETKLQLQGLKEIRQNCGSSHIGDYLLTKLCGSHS